MLLPLLLLACAADPPSVELVDPAEGKPGDALEIVGAHFAEGSQVSLGGQPLGELSVKGVTLIQGKVPDGLAPGPHELVVTAPDGQAAKKAGAFTVAAPPKALVPCGGEFTTYSAVATDTQLVKLDRHWPGDEKKREVIEIPFRDVEAVEYQATVGEDGEWCSAIILRTKKGDRHLFDDDHEVDLKSRAQEIAQGVGAGIDVLEEAPRPEAE
ncbi:MAG: IPT/TIG domain-containing protein [Alphaproteobacteria bacterium]|nr:IPT/TIG domain-containing protein [Alphaproteobacteria bacterium]